MDEDPDPLGWNFSTYWRHDQNLPKGTCKENEHFVSLGLSSSLDIWASIAYGRCDLCQEQNQQPVAGRNDDTCSEDSADLRCKNYFDNNNAYLDIQGEVQKFTASTYSCDDEDSTKNLFCDLEDAKTRAKFYECYPDTHQTYFNFHYSPCATANELEAEVQSYQQASQTEVVTPPVIATSKESWQSGQIPNGTVTHTLKVKDYHWDDTGSVLLEKVQE